MPWVSSPAIQKTIKLFLSNLFLHFFKLEDGQIYPLLAEECIILDLSGNARENFKVYQDRYPILNPEKHIDVYDRNGKFLFKFGEQGRGPEEYNRINDFCYHHNNQQYLIASTEGYVIYDSVGIFVKKVMWQNDTPVLKRNVIRRKQISSSLWNYRENDNWIMFQTLNNDWEKGDFVLVFQSKKNKNLKVISPKTQDDCFLNIKTDAGFILNAWDIVNEQLIVTIPAPNFKEMADKAAQNPETYPYYDRAKQIAGSLDENSNSIFAWVKLKNL